VEDQVSIRLPHGLLRELDRRARRHRRTRAELIRAALVAFIELPDGALEMRPADRIRDLFGSVKGLPSDLATRPERYFADFGRSRR
jgi:hypothetical protein